MGGSDNPRPSLSEKRMKTFLPKDNQEEASWRVVDADGVILGRLAAQIANALRGKDKAIYTPHIDTGDFVVVINAEKVRLSGRKEEQKQYMTYSGWRSGDKYHAVAEVRAKHPERIIEHAVKGMLPKNRLARKMLKKLKIYAGPNHPHEAQEPTVMKALA